MLFRNSPGSFACDPLALEATLAAVAAGHDRQMDAGRAGFLYMPLMHSEHPDHHLKVAKGGFLASLTDDLLAKL